MLTKQLANSSWFVAVTIYIASFFLVAFAFFPAAHGEETTQDTTKVNTVDSLEKKDKHSEAQAAKTKDSQSKKSKNASKNEVKKGGQSMFVVMDTTLGPIKIKLNPEKAPKTVDNFLKYVDEGFYNGTIFHRVIKGFMAQGGGFTSDLTQKPTHDPIKNEANNGLVNKRGTLAMARTMDPHSASAQFFINTVDNTFLNFKAENMQGWGYAVFGEVVEGMDVVDKMATVKTTSKKGYDDVPEAAIEIKSATRVEK